MKRQLLAFRATREPVQKLRCKLVRQPNPDK